MQEEMRHDGSLEVINLLYLILRGPNVTDPASEKR